MARRKSAESVAVEEVPVSVAVEEYVEDSEWSGEQVSEDSAPRKRGAAPLVLPELAKAFEKAQRKHERAVKAQAPAQAKVERLEKQLAEAREALAGLDDSAVKNAEQERDAAKVALDEGLASVSA